MGQLEKDGGTPSRDGPVGCFEVGLSCYVAEVHEILRGEEERVLELIFVDEQSRGKSEEGVQCT